MIIAPGIFFIFLRFSFFGLFEGGGGGGVKGKSIAENENNNYIRNTPYLRNSIANDKDFWYTCVK